MFLFPRNHAHRVKIEEFTCIRARGIPQPSQGARVHTGYLTELRRTPVIPRLQGHAPLTVSWERGCTPAMTRAREQDKGMPWPPGSCMNAFSDGHKGKHWAHPSYQMRWRCIRLTGVRSNAVCPMATMSCLGQPLGQGRSHLAHNRNMILTLESENISFWPKYHPRLNYWK